MLVDRGDRGRAASGSVRGGPCGCRCPRARAASSPRGTRRRPPSSCSVMPSASTSSARRRSPPSASRARFGRGAAVDREVAGVREGGGVRVHRVRQAALLPDLLEQPAGHAAAQHLVGDRQRPAVVVAGCRGSRQPRLRWACSVSSCSTTTCSVGAPAAAATGSSPPSARRSRARTGVDDRGVVEPAGGGDDHGGGPVPAREERRRCRRG